VILGLCVEQISHDRCPSELLRSASQIEIDIIVLHGIVTSETAVLFDFIEALPRRKHINDFFSDCRETDGLTWVLATQIR
jgi:hypothetical protein